MENWKSQAGLTIRTPILHPGPVPEAADLVIIGAGVVGTFTALYANRLGLKVVLLEKGRVAAEQSSRNWGWLRQQGRDADELPIVMEANRLWGDVNEAVGGRAGFVRGGCFYLARDEQRLEKFSQWMEIAKQHQLDTKWLTTRELAGNITHSAHNSPSDGPWVGAIHTPSDARAEPWAAVPAVAALAADEGVQIIENCAVRALDQKAGQVTGIVSEHGTVHAEQVVLAGGAWSSLFLQRHGCFIPQLSFKGTVVRTAPLPKVTDGMAIDEGLAFRRREDGGYSLASRDRVDAYLGRDVVRSLRYYLTTMRQSMDHPKFHPFAPSGFPDGWMTPRRWDADEESPFERTRVLDPAPNRNSVKRSMSEFRRLFPGLGELNILNAWAGMIDTMPDIVPVIDRVPGVDGLILATGMSGHGFALGPGVGKIVAEMAAGRDSTHDLKRFRYSRFSDGSPLRVGPSV